MQNLFKSRMVIRKYVDFGLKFTATKILTMALILPIVLGIATSAKAQSDLIISGVVDGPLSGGVPKAVELLVVNNIADLSIYGFGSANNGGGTDGEELTFPAVSATAGSFIYVASEATGFTSFFGFAPDYTSGAAAINGDDAIELFQNGSVVDVFGDINVDGNGEPWEYQDGWAKRVDATGPDGTTFVLANWTFSGPNALDGEITNASAATPFPIILPTITNLVISGVIDGPLSGGTPKAIEFFVVNDITDLSAYGFGSANNGGGSDGEEFTFPAVNAVAGSYIYVASEVTQFGNFFGFAPDYTSGTASINGDDAIELFQDGVVVDVFGDINVDGNGEPWEYQDGWAKRVDGTGPDGSTFALGNWTFSGPNALDGETTNATAATPFPLPGAPGSTDLLITGVIDGPLPGGLPKAVEFLVLNDITNLSIYGFGSANNGGGSDGEEFTFPAGTATAGSFIYVASEATEFDNFFGFAPDYTGGAANINGDDAIELFQNGGVVDVFGDINVDGNGQPWEYLDGWAKRVDSTGPDGSTFVLANWTFSGPNALDGETSNATAATPFPMAGIDLLITGIVDGPLSGGTPKAVEFYVIQNISDLSVYGFGSANNGGGTDGEEFTFPAGSATAGSFIYVASEAIQFNNFFGFSPDHTSSAANINGDDAIELFKEGAVVDVFGDINVDGNGEPWEYLDGWASRISGTGPDGSTFILANWTFSGPNALDGETSNATATSPFPLGTYSTTSPPAFAEIFEIQGSGLVSPFENLIVTTEDNVVTGVAPNGFFIQTPTVRSDSDSETSDGIFVFTGGAPAVTIGDQVDVTGTIVEFFELTEIGSSPTVSIDFSGAALPAPVLLDGNTPSPNQPQPANEMERFEGMLVEILEGFATGATDQFGDVAVVAGSSRAFREPGIIFPGLSGLPIWDGNPEIFEINPDALGLPNESVPAGAEVSATGPLSFSFGDYQIHPTTFSFSGATEPRPVRDRIAGEFTVATQNMFRLFEGQSDFADRVTKFSMQIRDILGAPDIIAVQEVENLSALQALANKIQTDDAGIVYMPYLVEGNDVGGIDVGFLVRNTVQVNAVTQLGANEIFSFDNSLLHDRPPLLLVGEFLVSGSPVPISVLGLHQRSLSGIEGSQSTRIRLKRQTQATSVSLMVDSLQTANPNINLVVTGDFNAYQFTDGYADVLGQIMGTPADNTQAQLPGTDEVAPDLSNEILSLPTEEQYSFVFRGSAQSLDHMLVSELLQSKVSGIEYARGNADVPSTLINDNSTPLRSSDHDGLVLFLDLTPPEIVVNPDPAQLWPPNHKYNTFNISDFVVSVNDNGSSDISLDDVFVTSVTSDEPENGRGDGNTTNDIVIVDCQTVDLRAERDGRGNGRVYTIHLAAEDLSGNTGTALFQVHVPKNKSNNSAIDDGPVYEVQSGCSAPETLAKSTQSKVAELNNIPTVFMLEQNYPNPFNPETVIHFSLPKASSVEITVFNMLGQKIQNLSNTRYEAGIHSISWNGKDQNGNFVSSGIYLYQLRAGNFLQVKKMTLLR